MIKTIILTLFISSIGQAQEIPALGNGSSINLKDALKGKTVWFFFKPDCPICHVQVKNYKCLGKELMKRVYPIGFAASEKKLWIESKKLKLKTYGFSKAYYADKGVTEIFKLTSNASPQIYFMDQNKKTAHHLGAVECHKIKNFLEN